MQKDDFYNDGCHTFETRQFFIYFLKRKFDFERNFMYVK